MLKILVKKHAVDKDHVELWTANSSGEFKHLSAVVHEDFFWLPGTGPHAHRLINRIEESDSVMFTLIPDNA